MSRGSSMTALLLAFAVVLAGCTPASTPSLDGDLAAHDPALVIDGDDWYVYSTGSSRGDGNIQIRHSTDGISWQYVGEVWKQKPEWIVQSVRGVDNLWAPELVEHEGTWYLYYAASTFGSNHSVIGLATNGTLDPDDPDYKWVDRGQVLASATTDDFNAIDPGAIVATDGTPWMAFGSFWSGIRMVELEWPSGLRVDDAEPLRLADRGSPPNAIEAAYIVEHDGDYYLFFSRDSCCQGVRSTYNIAVGRSDAVTGPYIDHDGVPLLEDGGTAILGTQGSVIGPGGQSASSGYLAFHYYDGDAGGATRLAIRRIAWDADGWPSISR